MPNPLHPASDAAAITQGRRAAKVAGDRLDGHSVIVTGAGSADEGDGTGSAIARLFAAEGARICIADNDQERAQRTCTQIEASGGEAFIAIGDVTDDDTCRRIVTETIERFGALDTLVNNLGMGGAYERLEVMDRATWTKLFDVNFKSALQMCAHAVPALVRNGGGSIVNISSLAGIQAVGHFAYGPAKAALHGLTRELAFVYGRDGIRANTIAPGHIRTPLAIRSSSPQSRALRRRVAPLGIDGDAWDIAWTAAFLASPEARFITGTLLPVDGGVSTITAMSGYGLLQDDGDQSVEVP